MSDAKQTPLHERLESVPAALRCIVDHSPLSSSSYPIGALCHEAAAALRAQGPNLLLEWAVSRWRDEVEHRPLVNKNRRSLDDAWRQVIRWAGGDDGALIGPAHDELFASAPQASQPPQGAGIADLRDAKWLDPECAHAGALVSAQHGASDNSGQAQPSRCEFADDPRGCYRVRCQLGKKCVGEKEGKDHQ